MALSLSGFRIAQHACQATTILVAFAAALAFTIATAATLTIRLRATGLAGTTAGLGTARLATWAAWLTRLAAFGAAGLWFAGGKPTTGLAERLTTTRTSRIVRGPAWPALTILGGNRCFR